MSLGASQALHCTAHPPFLAASSVAPQRSKPNTKCINANPIRSGLPCHKPTCTPRCALGAAPEAARCPCPREGRAFLRFFTPPHTMGPSEKPAQQRGEKASCQAPQPLGPGGPAPPRSPWAPAGSGARRCCAGGGGNGARAPGPATRPAAPRPPCGGVPGRPAGRRAPRQEILAGLGAAEGAAAPGSGGSGIIFYQRRDQLPHPVTGPHTKALTDLEKLGRPGGVGESRARGWGLTVPPARPPPPATPPRGARGRRSSAPKSPTQKSPLRPAEGHGEAAPRRAMAPASARPAAPRGPGALPPRGRRAGGALWGAGHLPSGCGIILLHK